MRFSCVFHCRGCVYFSFSLRFDGRGGSTRSGGVFRNTHPRLPARLPAVSGAAVAPRFLLQVRCMQLGGPSDPTVVSGSADGTVRVWDLRAVRAAGGGGGGSRLTLRGHSRELSCLRFDWTKVVSGDAGGELRIWDLTR